MGGLFYCQHETKFTQVRPASTFTEAVLASHQGRPTWVLLFIKESDGEISIIGKGGEDFSAAWSDEMALK
ncbi:hypothetical protein GSbR_15510 [Geobacter sp. SVR]|nr:hypothetical protein GSVR_00720 [Geobacter sp. SVR]GCF84951.1 hypothetical protein GSbR_15510 [Geobacter sp. SVR]